MTNERKVERKVTDKKQALKQAENFCAYQERSQQEVRDKLYELGLFSADVEEIIAELIQTNFINEERFAITYTSGKLRLKKWGKLKIKQGLKLKRVPDKLINTVLNNIDQDEYLEILNSLLIKKSAVLAEKDPFRKKYKLSRYLAGKGFESDLIFDILKNNKLA